MPTAEQLARSRDLKVQMKELQQESDQEIVFRETSPVKRYVILYSRLDGEPVEVSMALAEKVLDKRLPDGGFMFTTNPDEAPEYKVGDVKCFLHEESIERASGILDEVGLTGITCPAAGLASAYSKRVHAQHRHRQQWEAYQEHMNQAERRTSEARQEAQLEATLALARQAAGVPEVPVERHDCEECGWVNEKNTSFGLDVHKRIVHKKEAADAVTE